MPILECDCGEKLSFTETALRRAGGKGMNCPGCGSLLRLPPSGKTPPPLPEAENLRVQVVNPPPLPSASRHRGNRQLPAAVVAVVCAAAVVLLVLAWMAAWRFGPGSGAASQASADADRAAVHRWLQNHLNDPDFQEVRWWPTRRLQKSRDRSMESIVGYKKRAESQLNRLLEQDRKPPPPGLAKRDLSFSINRQKRIVADYEQRIQELKEAPIPSACKIRYRAKNGFGSWVLQEDIFQVENGRALRVQGWLQPDLKVHGELTSSDTFYYANEDFLADDEPADVQEPDERQPAEQLIEFLAD